jgi:hypothetical protein
MHADVPPEVFHASKISGLQRLEPRVSTHGKAWIYAARGQLTASMFLGKHSDFILGSGYEGEHPYIFERFVGAFERAKRGKGGSIYVLPGESFRAGLTSFTAEVVSEETLEPLREIVVPDAAEPLLKYKREGQLDIYRFPDRPSHVPADDSDLIEAARELYAKHGQKLVDYLRRECGDGLEHVIRALES